ncbi:MAG TPA: c-type cytochrome [Pirellulaceae bacterium]|nr:c-type cytochrome [Pirellulaceae bacterium]HMP71302.1 c-type cytochrome [Pirellulaceae bacterium]
MAMNRINHPMNLMAHRLEPELTFFVGFSDRLRSNRRLSCAVQLYRVVLIRLVILIFLLGYVLGTLAASAQSLEEELQRVSLEDLAAGARQFGDASRGAIIFHQPSMTCSKCHSIGIEASALGPDLTSLGREVSDESLIESVLYPSRVIREGYDSLTVLTIDGKLISALLVEQTTEQITLRDVARDGEVVTIATEEIDEVKQNELSIMPAGLLNQLHSKQQFYDLMRYLYEIRDGGADRARQLQPSQSLLAFTIPEYENHLDHAGMISSWNDESYLRGQAMYQRVCANCHGTHEQPGSLPTSPRFADDKFKNGSDPLSMYRTLTHGFGQMAAQTWMVPTQKYDVIHYIRQAYLETHNPSELTPVDANYMASLPPGDSRGPEPSQIEVWSAMDYGPSLIHTYEIPGSPHNFAYKGVAVRLDSGAGGVSRGSHWIVFDTDTLRVAAGWRSTHQNEITNSNNFIDWRAIQFNGEHGVHPQIVGEVAFANATAPGWADPASGAFTDDQRVLGRDDRRYGPLPRDWGQFRGLYHFDQRVVFQYSIGETEILESPSVQVRDVGPPLIWRTFNIGPRQRDLILQVAQQPTSVVRMAVASNSSVTGVLHANSEHHTNTTRLIAGFAPRDTNAQWLVQDGQLRLRLPAGDDSLRFSVWQPTEIPTSLDETIVSGTAQAIAEPTFVDANLELVQFTRGGPPRWPQVLTTQAVIGANEGPFSVDILTAPETNPWLAQTRFTGLDFYPDGRIAICTWDGDVWLVTPDPATEEVPAELALRWQRIATGLFQPLGLKIVNDRIHVICRDQLCVLHDLNGDGEIDYYQCLNNDHQVTEHFHEFAMGLQTDAAGNFYYAKSGCHGKAAIVPHHGTLLRVSPDGKHTQILANGFRAANGVCLNPDGSFVVTDQEGFWNPKNRINWVTVDDSGQPQFYGNMLGYHDVADSSDDAMVQPLCWITNDFDRSPAELLWVESQRWGPLHGSLLNTSYGYGKVFLVLHENVRGTMQGGMIELPLPTFPTGVMRGRFHPLDGQLYLCGMFAWAGSATHPGGLYRVRYNEQPVGFPLELRVRTAGVELTFAEELDPKSIADLDNFAIQAWDLKRTERYGSEHYNERPWQVESAELLPDQKTIRLRVPEIAPTWGMEIVYTVQSSSGKRLHGKIHNTIHQLGE